MIFLRAAALLLLFLACENKSEPTVEIGPQKPRGLGSNSQPIPETKRDPLDEDNRMGGEPLAEDGKRLPAEKSPTPEVEAPPAPNPDVVPPAPKYVWKSAANGEVPTGGISPGSINGYAIYLCRVKLASGNYQPGQVLPEDGVCYITYEGDIYYASTYEVLLIVDGEVGDSFELVLAENGAVTPKAFAAGSEAGQPLYYCVTLFDSDYRVGKVGPGYGGCKYPDGEKEALAHFYYVLTGK